MNYLHTWLYGVLLLLGICSCEHPEVGPVKGPEICPASNNFKVKSPIQASPSSIDFTTDSVVFTASFNEAVPWRIRVTGKITGAYKAFSGQGKQVKATWDGSSDTAIFFQNELCNVKLTVPCEDSVSGASVGIATPKTHGGTLIDDYDGNGEQPGWWKSFKTDEFIAAEKRDDLDAPQGSFYYHVEGEDVNPDGFLGLIGSNAPMSLGLPASPSGVYFNIIVGGEPGTEVELRIVESDEDELSSFHTIDWKGWKLLSIPYNDFSFTSIDTSKATAFERNPDQVESLKIALRTANKGSRALLYYDYPVFTTGEAFKP